MQVNSYDTTNTTLQSTTHFAVNAFQSLSIARSAADELDGCCRVIVVELCGLVVVRGPHALVVVHCSGPPSDRYTHSRESVVSTYRGQPRRGRPCIGALMAPTRPVANRASSMRYTTATTKTSCKWNSVCVPATRRGHQ